MNFDTITIKSIRQDQIGLSSYSYKYNFGYNQFKPDKPMTVIELMDTVKELGLNRLQLCENTGYVEFSKNKLNELSDKAKSIGLSIELGMANLSQDSVLKHLEIAEIFSAKILRVVLMANNTLPVKNKEEFINYNKNILKKVLPRIKDMGLSIGIENHFNLPSNDLVRMVKEIGDKKIGLIFDSINCLGFIERPKEVIKAFGPYILGIHLKDYIVKKIIADFKIMVVPLGEGQQDIKRILLSSLQYNPDLSILIEMPIQNEGNQSNSEIMELEKTAVKRCADYLHKILS